MGIINFDFIFTIWSNITYAFREKMITYKRLSTEFTTLMKKGKVDIAPTYILLREDDMIYLASIPTHEQAKLTYITYACREKIMGTANEKLGTAYHLCM